MMARYNSDAKYDDDEVYDADDPSPYGGPYRWICEVDWDWGGYQDESPYLIGFSCERGKEHFARGSGDGLENTPPGEATVTLSDVAGRLNPETNSDVEPGKRVRVRLMDNTASDEIYAVFEGVINDIDLDPIAQTLILSIRDDIETLRNKTTTIAPKLNIYAHEAIGYVLDDVGLVGGLEASNTPVKVFACEDRNALNVIEDLVTASLGQLFVSRNGTLVYYPVNYDGMASYSIGEAECYKDVRQGRPWDERYSRITVTAQGWGRSKVKVLWKSDGMISVPSGGSVSFVARFNNLCEPIQPEQGRDFNGTYISSGQILPVFRVVLSAIQAKSCTVTIHNDSPYPFATSITIRGREFVTSYAVNEEKYQPWTHIPTYNDGQVSLLKKHVSTDTTVPLAARRSFSLASPFLQDNNFAEAYADALLTFLAAGPRTLTIVMENNPTVAQQFGIELLDKVTAVFATLSINRQYYLGRIRHEWVAESGQGVKTTMTLISRLYDGSTITPEPIQEVPEVPDPGDTGEDGQGNPLLPPPGSGGCLWTAPANGPFAATFDASVMYNYGAQRSRYYSLACRVRNVSYANPTAYEITAKIEETLDGGKTWVASTVGATVYAINKAGTVVGTSTPTYANGVWHGSFASTVGQAPATWGFVLELAEGTPVYLRGAIVGAGSYGAVRTGQQIATVPGKTYCIETGGGPITDQARCDIPGCAPRYYLHLSPISDVWYDHPTVWVGGYSWAGWFANGTSTLGYLAYEQIYPQHRAYWNAVQSAYWVGYWDTGGDLQGTMTYTVYEATQAGNKRVTVSSFLVSNICPVA